jgi:hypothetical protein
MKTESYLHKFAHLLVQLGFTWRALVIFESFLIAFSLGTFGFAYIQNWDNFIYFTLLMTPLVILIVLLLFLMLNRRFQLKGLMLQIEVGRGTGNTSNLIAFKKDIWHKIQIAIACFATSIVIAIGLVVLLIAIGMEDIIEIFFILYWTVGVIIVFIIFWPFYSKKLQN